MKYVFVRSCVVRRVRTVFLISDWLDSGQDFCPEIVHCTGT